MLKILKKKNGQKSKKRREDVIGDKIGEADIRVRSGSRNEKEEAEKEIQKAMINIKNKYGKNAIIKGMNLQKEGTTIERNGQIGGHKE